MHGTFRFIIDNFCKHIINKNLINVIVIGALLIDNEIINKNKTPFKLTIQINKRKSGENALTKFNHWSYIKFKKTFLYFSNQTMCTFTVDFFCAFFIMESLLNNLCIQCIKDILRF